MTSWVAPVRAEVERWGIVHARVTAWKAVVSKTGNCFLTSPKQVARQQGAVPTVGLDTYATMAGNTIAVHVLTPSRIMTLTLHLAPGAASEDLPGMVELARLAYGRLR